MNTLNWMLVLIGTLALVAVVIILLRRRASRLALVRRVRELEPLAEAGRALSVAELDVDALCELIYDQASRIVDTSTFQIGLFEDDCCYHIKLWQVEGERQQPESFDLSDGEGIVAWVQRTGQPLLVRDFEREADTLPARPRYISPSAPRSAVFVPLLAGVEVIGALAIQSYSPAAFSQEHTRLLSIIGNQAASAIARARLLEGERQRVKQLSLIAEVSRQVAAIFDLDTLFTRVVELVHDAFGYYHVGVFTPDPEAADDELVLKASTCPSLIGDKLKIGQGVAGHAARTGEPLLVPNVAQDTRYIPVSALPDTRSVIAIPLKFGGEILGVLIVQSGGGQETSGQTQVLGEDDLFVMQMLADQVAVAIHGARLYQAERRRSGQLEAVGEVGRAIVSNLNLGELLDEVVCLVKGRFGYRHVALFMVNGDMIEFRAGAGSQAEEWTQAGRQLAIDGPGLIAHATRTGDPIMCNDVAADARYLPAMPGTCSELVVPLRVGDRVLAVLDVQSDRISAFDESDLFSLQALGDAVAVSIRNAMLYASERSRRRIADTLRESVAVLASTLDLDTVLDRILESLARVIKYDAVAVLLFNEGEQDGPGTLTIRAARGLPQVVNVVGQQVPVQEGGRFVRLNERRGPLIFGEEDGAGAYHDLIGLPQNHSCLGAPLIARDVMIGTLTVDRLDPLAYGPDDAEIVAALAGQAALAINNARLYEAEREQAWVSTALLQVAEATTRAESLDDVLTTVVRITPMLSGVDRCGILLWDAERGAFCGSHVHGLSRQGASLFKNWEVRLGEWWGLDEVCDTQSPFQWSEDGLENWVKEIFGSGDTLMLPLVTRGELPAAPSTPSPEPVSVANGGRNRLAGVMLVGTRQGETLDLRGVGSVHRIQMLSGIANQAALAIESSQLAAAQREEAWVNMALLQVAEAIGSQMELSEVLSTIVRLTPLLVGVEACLVFLWDEVAGVYTPGAAYGLSRGDLAAFYKLRVSGPEWPLDRTGPSEYLLPSSSLPPLVTRNLGLHSAIALPLRAKGSVVGVMVVAGASPSLAKHSRQTHILLGIAHQAAIAVENVSLVRQLAARERLEREIELARNIQASFLPECCPEAPGWEIGTFWQAARQVGGDFYDFIPRPRDHYALVIADVADKGVPAALFMALCRTLVRAATLGGYRLPAEALTRTNEMILADARPSDLFVTMVMADLSPVGKVVVANAGHNPPMVVRAGGEIEYLSNHGIAMGVVEKVYLENHTSRLREGDVLVLYTDGLPDALNSQEEEFGMERLETCVREHLDEPAHSIVRAIQETVSDFVGGEPSFDDLTLVVAKRLV